MACRVQTPSKNTKALQLTPLCWWLSDTPDINFTVETIRRQPQASRLLQDFAAAHHERLTSPVTIQHSRCLFDDCSKLRSPIKRPRNNCLRLETRPFFTPGAWRCRRSRALLAVAVLNTPRQADSRPRTQKLTWNLENLKKRATFGSETYQSSPFFYLFFMLHLRFRPENRSSAPGMRHFRLKGAPSIDDRQTWPEAHGARL